MNPGYKYPLIVFLILVVIGLGYLVFRKLPGGVTDKVAEFGESLVVEEDAALGGNGQSQTDGQDGRNEQTELQIADRHRTLIEKARTKFARTDLLGARADAEAVLAMADVKPFSPAWLAAAGLVSKVNTVLFNSDAPAPEKLRYEVKRGDNLVKISRNFNTTVNALIRGNKNLDSTDSTIYPDMVFKIYKGDWSVTAYKSTFALVVHDGDRVFKLYDVAIGKQGRTPVGTFVVKDKIREPAWTPPGKNIPFGHPDNVLGTRWLGIRPTGDTDPTLRGYGIHGTWEPESIGSAASQGCIRMLNEDVEELFDIIPVGTPVTIKD